MAVKAAPGSPPPGSRSPTMRRCALEEIGRNSVSPWTTPRMIASHHVTRDHPTFSSPRRTAGTLAAMELRRAGRSGLLVSSVALGTKTWCRDTDVHEAAEQLLLFPASGCTLILTAASYVEYSADARLESLLSERD